MTRFIKISLMVVVFSFLWGAWWGYRERFFKSQGSFRGEQVRVLALQGALPKEFLTDLETTESVRVLLTEKSSESELLREMLSHFMNYDLIQFSSFMSRSFIIENVFHPLDAKQVSRANDVSIDFIHLDYDPANHFVLPLTWGISGFLIHTKKVSLNNESLKELVTASKKLAAIHSPVEIFNLAVKLKPIIRTWVDTGQLEELSKTVKEVKDMVALGPDNLNEKVQSGDFTALQMYSGQAARWVGGESNYRFVVPEDRGVLWISLIGVSRGAEDPDKAFRLIDLFLEEKINKKLVVAAAQASVLNSLNPSDLLPLQKAKFLRQVPLSRVELYIDREALDPIWSQTYRKEWVEAK